MAKREAKFTIRGDDKSRPAVDSAKRGMDGLGNNAKKLGDTLKTAFTIGAVVAFGKQVKSTVDDLVRAYSIQEQAERKLSAAVANNPYLDESNARSLQRFASSLQEVTTVGDETTLTMASMLASFGRTQTEIEQVITAATDLSAATGMTLDSAVRNLNKTFGGMSGELGELIPELKDLSTEQLKAGDGVELVARQFDGLAQSMEGTVDYIDRSFDNAWSDLQEALGKRFAEAAKPAKTFFTDLITDMTNTITRIDDLKLAFADLADVMNQSALQQAYGFAGMTEDQLNSVIGDSRSIISEGLLALFDETGAAESFAQAGQGGFFDRVKGALGVGANIATGNFANTKLVQALNEILGPQATREDLENLSTNQLIEVIQQLPDDISRSIDVTALKDAAGVLERAIRAGTTRGRIQVEPSRVSDLIGGGGGGGGDGGGQPGSVRGSPDAKWQKNVEKVWGQHVATMGEGLDTLSLHFGTLDMEALAFAENLGPLEEATAKMGDLTLQTTTAIASLGTAAEGTASQVNEVGESFTEGPQGAAGSSFMPSGGGGGNGVVGDALGAALGPIGMLAEALIDIAMKIEAVVALTAPLGLILDGILAVMAPVINEGLAPLVGIFTMLGEIVGHLLLPIFELMFPVVEALGKAFVWLYNNAFVNVYNGVREFGNKVYNAFASMINWVIGILNKIPGVNINGVSKRDLGYGTIDPISYEDLVGTGQDVIGGGGGSPANYTTGRNITINMVVNTDALVGNDGIREFALMIRDEIYEAEALGA